MGKYDDIIDLERPKSKRPKMSTEDRVAQFSPFSALTGLNNTLDKTREIHVAKNDDSRK